jgi:hypothetical protein
MGDNSAGVFIPTPAVQQMKALFLRRDFPLACEPT